LFLFNGLEKGVFKMNSSIQVILIIGSFLSLCWILRKIRKSQVKVEDSIFWIISSSLIFLISLLPNIISKISNLLGFQSPANFIFLCVVFIVIIKLFGMSIKVSKLESQIISLTQEIALREIKKN